MNQIYHVSSSPHVRSKLHTGPVMYNVIISLLPATCVGIWRFGTRAAIIVLLSILTAVASEAVCCKIMKKELTIKDGSAVVTGLLLALCLSPLVPFYIPILGALFAIVVVKCMFGGLGKNFINPALAARCFLLISFSGTMTAYGVDGVSSATPLEVLKGGSAVNITEMFLGTSTGVIGCSALALLVGGLYLWISGGITWEIPASMIGAFGIFMIIFGGQGLDGKFLLAHLCGGGILMGAFFMATDPVTSPVSSTGQLLYGAIAGILSGLFRVNGSAADSVSYAIIITNLVTPMIDQFIVPKPFAYRKQDGQSFFSIATIAPALVLTLITLIAGVALSGVFGLTKDTIEEQERAAQAAAYKEVVTGAEEIVEWEEGRAAVEALDGAVYGSDFGRAYINDAYKGVDASGNTVGYAISVTSADGFDGKITLAVGISADGTLNGISFTELNETAGMGMRADEPEFKDQFAGKNVARFELMKGGGSTEDSQIDSISGASITSGAVVNAVNAALDFYAANGGAASADAAA